MAFEFGIVSGADLEAPESLIWDCESICQHGDRDAGSLSGGTKLLSDRVVGVGVHECLVDLVGDVAFQTANDVSVGEALALASFEIGDGARFPMPHARQNNPM